MNAEKLDRLQKQLDSINSDPELPKFLSDLREKRIAYANSFESPSQMIAKCDALIADLDSTKKQLQEMTFKVYELRGAMGRMEK